MPSILTALFKPKPLLDQDTASWMYEVFDWALANFDKEEFLQRSKLIQPTNDFFPGKVDSVHTLAETIFKHTLNYAGLQHWPFQLQAPEKFQGLPPPQLQIENSHAIRRNSLSAEQAIALTNGQPLFISYRPQQTGKPEDLSSTYAHLLAQHIAIQAQQLPPGGQELFSAGTEVLAIFMGFGVMFANSAYTYKGSCASCYNPAANRQSALTEDEATFALALFCHHKNIVYKEATHYLKSHLKSSYKRAAYQIAVDPKRFHCK